jgi:Uma2 family endonuclease
LDWASEHPHAEWVDGEVIEFITVKGRHALVFGFLFELVRSFVRIRQLGMVLSEPFEMRILEGQSARRPDIFVVLNEHLDRYSDDRLDGPADLVVEIVSDDSVTRDRDEKRDEYAAAGIREYWIVEGRTDRSGFELLVLNDAGSYEPPAPDAGGRMHSRVLRGFWVDPSWLAEYALPDPDRILDQIAPGIFEERAKRLRA